MMPSKHYARQTNTAAECKDEDCKTLLYNFVNEKKSHHGCPCGMARREGEKIHRDCGKHVHSVVGWPSSSKHQLCHANHNQIKDQYCKREQKNQSILKGHNHINTISCITVVTFKFNTISITVCHTALQFMNVLMQTLPLVTDFVSKCVKVKGFVFKFKLYISHYCHDQSFKV